MFKKLTFVFTFLVFTSLNLYAQESCGCSTSACSASQTCPAGKSAVCVCSASGCSSSCVTEPPINDARAESISGVLSSAYGLNFQFQPTNKNYELSSAKISGLPIWELLEELSRNGEITINGQNLDFWKNMNKTLLGGGEFKICSGGASVQRILGVISFVSGKQFKITSGNAEAIIKGRIEGNNLTEVLNSLQKNGEVTVAEID